MADHSCPTCEATFDGQRGLSVHHSRVHDEQLPNRECGACGTAFHCEYERKYCSDECRNETVSFAGEHNPNYDGSSEQTTCEICGESFEYYPSEKEGVYCSECVEAKNWQNPPTIDGKDHPRWRGGQLTVECAVCGEIVERYPSHINGEATLCSEECQRNWLSEEFTGEGHPNWKGGGVGYYSSGWYSVRRKALDRDDHECVLCGTTREELGRNPDVHHVVPVRVYDAAEAYEIADAHRVKNVVTLCPPCHRRAEFGHVERQRLWEAIDVDSETAAVGVDGVN